MYQTILFDLDGTLTDSSPGIIHSVAYALDKMGLPIPHEKELSLFIGPPLQESFSQYFQLSAADCQRAIGYFREYFSATGIFENTLYPAVPEVLARLKQAGKQLLVATSKPEPYAIRILEHFEIEGFFDLVAGASMDSSRSQKADIIAHALRSGQITDCGKCVMVGDRKHDILGAQSHQMDAIGLLSGFGSQQELETAGTTHLLASLADLPSFLAGQTG